MKDGINDYLVHGAAAAVNPERTGTKASACYLLQVAGGESAVVRLRLTGASAVPAGAPFGAAFDVLFAERLQEADDFYRAVTPA